MLEQILMEIHNWFRVRGDANGIHPGTYTIENGGIALPFLQEGQYFRIMGSVFNDGLHQYFAPKPPEEETPDVEAQENEADVPATDAPSEDPQKLQDETFNGIIWALAIPPAVVKLAEEIATWQEKNGAAASGVYQSESFGGYSYSKAVDSATGGAVTWESAFRMQLNPYRKLREV